MELVAFSPLHHLAGVAALWARTLGDSYPVPERVLTWRLAGRTTAEPGDGLVALERGAVVGFAMGELERRADGTGSAGHVLAVVVDPDHQRRGLGALLLDGIEIRFRQAGARESHIAGSLGRFWSGIPDNLTAARAFFASCGYELPQCVTDLVVPLDTYRRRPAYTQAMRRAGVRPALATTADLPALIDFQLREFPGWYPSMIQMIASGDLSNVLMMKRGSDIVGTIQTFTPSSRWRGPNLAWEGIFGPAIGGYGAVGIAKAARGQGLGAAMCQEAACHVKRQGGSCCVIDWTHLVEFYALVGAKPWQTFWRGSKTL